MLLNILEIPEVLTAMLYLKVEIKNYVPIYFNVNSLFVLQSFIPTFILVISLSYQ